MWFIIYAIRKSAKFQLFLFESLLMILSLAILAAILAFHHLLT
jgi:hypothetical protein